MMLFPDAFFNKFPDKVASKVLNNIPRNRTFRYFASFFIVPARPFKEIPWSSKDLTILMIS